MTSSSTLPSVEAMIVRLGIAATAIASLGIAGTTIPATIPSATASATPVVASAPDRSVAESGGHVVVVVRLAQRAKKSTRVRWRTAAGTATAGADYRSGKGSLTIPKGARSGKVRVAIVNDTRPEPDETFGVKFKPAHGKPVTATVTIRANDGGSGSAGGKGSSTGSTLRIPRTITGTFSGQKGPAYDQTMTWSGTLTYVYDPKWDGRDHPEWKLQSGSLTWNFKNTFNGCTASGAVTTAGFDSSADARILYPSYLDGAPYDYALGAMLSGPSRMLPINCNGQTGEYHQEIYLSTDFQSTSSLFSFTGSRSEAANARTESWNFTGSDPFDWKITFSAP